MVTEFRLYGNHYSADELEGSCTLAIAMMTEDIDLPGRPARKWWAYDFATFEKVWIAAHSINDWCVSKQGKPGWTAVGMLSQLMFHSLVILKAA